jgi:hypothetical protein
MPKTVSPVIASRSIGSKPQPRLHGLLGIVAFHATTRYGHHLASRGRPVSIRRTRFGELMVEVPVSG